MLVTSYYDIYNKPSLFIEYIYYFYDLAISGIPITVFTEEKYVSKFRIFGPNITVISIPLEDFELYRIGSSYQGQLPSNRNYQKDTKEYLALMNTKIEIIKKAAEISEDNTFIWVDFDILKYVRNKHLITEKLHDLNSRTFDKIIIPGFSEVCGGNTNEITSHFYGTFFIMPKKFIEDFFQHSKNVFTDFCKFPQYNICWETNIWCIIKMFAMGDSITWYWADKNDTLITTLDSVLISKHSITDSILKS
jgi:hypothetical protein